MDISTRQNGTSTVVDVIGDITLYNSPEVRRVVLSLFQVKSASAGDREPDARQLY